VKDLRATVICGLLLLGAAGIAQTASAQSAVSSRGNCAGVEDLGRFTIREARLHDPFWMLRWRRPSAATVRAIEGLKGTRYSFATVNAVSKTIESEAWLQSSANDLIHVDLSDIRVSNCRDEQLDVAFTVFSASVSPIVSPTFEWRSTEKPVHETAGVFRQSSWKFAPQLGFDEALRLTAGGHMEGNWTGAGPFGRIQAIGVGSTASHAISASFAGGHDSSARWLQRASWAFDLADTLVPAGANQVEKRGIGARFAAASKPQKGIVTRMGGMLEAGRLASSVGAADLPPGTVSDANFTSIGLFGGLTGRIANQTVMASYGVTLGSRGAGFHGDWRRELADVAHDMWLPFADHRVFELEHRVTLGRLQTLGTVPAAILFLGGATQTQNVLNVADDWQVQTSPVIRSVPANQFSAADVGIGGNAFVSYNATAAVTVWGKPVVPKELLDEPQFTDQLMAQLTSARSALDVIYRADDRNFQAIRARLESLRATLDAVTSAVATVRAASVLSNADFQPCEDSVQASRSAVEHASSDKPFQAYGWVMEMLPDGNNALEDVVTVCGSELVETLRGVGATTTDLESSTRDLEREANEIEANFRAIDTRKSAASAASDMKYADKALDVILRQLNVTSVSPVFLFDVANLRPAGGHYAGTQYAIGGGVRFTLLSTVSLTATYAVNPHARAGAASSAFVVSLTTRNLFE